MKIHWEESQESLATTLHIPSLRIDLHLPEVGPEFSLSLCFCRAFVNVKFLRVRWVDFEVREDLAERLLQNLEPSDWSAMVTRLAEKNLHLPRFDP